MTVLTMKAMGINDLLNFDFMDPPPPQASPRCAGLYLSVPSVAAQPGLHRCGLAHRQRGRWPSMPTATPALSSPTRPATTPPANATPQPHLTPQVDFAIQVDVPSSPASSSPKHSRLAHACLPLPT